MATFLPPPLLFSEGFLLTSRIRRGAFYIYNSLSRKRRCQDIKEALDSVKTFEGEEAKSAPEKKEEGTSDTREKEKGGIKVALACRMQKESFPVYMEGRRRLPSRSRAIKNLFSFLSPFFPFFPFLGDDSDKVTEPLTVPFPFCPPSFLPRKQAMPPRPVTFPHVRWSL